MISQSEWNNALIERHGRDLFNKAQNTTVAVCGLGGLGSNIAPLLIRMGIKRLILIDFDKVDLTNIHRQNYLLSDVGRLKTEALKDGLLKICPFGEIITHNEKITEDNIHSLLSEADIICEAFDNAECKAMLVNYILEHYPKKYIISASGMAGLNEADLIKTRRITDRFYLCGDGVSDIDKGFSLCASRVAVCAANQAHCVIRILNELK